MIKKYWKFLATILTLICIFILFFAWYTQKQEAFFSQRLAEQGLTGMNVTMLSKAGGVSYVAQVFGADNSTHTLVYVAGKWFDTGMK